MAYVICEPCVGVKDRACVDVCPMNCIYEVQRDGLPDMLFIHPEECIDCDNCRPYCPVDAIYPDDEVPDEWRTYVATNREAFAA